MREEFAKILPWDSEFFGLRIGRVTAQELTPAEAHAVREWAVTEKVDCVYFLSGCESKSARAAEEAGFRLVDVRVTLDDSAGVRVEPRIESSTEIRPADPADFDALATIARQGHTDTRFFSDPGFGRARAAELYATWLRRSFERVEEVVWGAYLEGMPVGYLTCRRDDSTTGSIGLVGVAEEARGLGLGQALVRKSQRWFGVQGLTRATVVTQGRNVGAQRLYQTCGFRTAKMQLWHHLWPRNSRHESDFGHTRVVTSMGKVDGA